MDGNAANGEQTTIYFKYNWWLNSLTKWFVLLSISMLARAVPLLRELHSGTLVLTGAGSAWVASLVACLTTEVEEKISCRVQLSFIKLPTTALLQTPRGIFNEWDVLRDVCMHFGICYLDFWMDFRCFLLYKWFLKNLMHSCFAFFTSLINTFIWLKE